LKWVGGVAATLVLVVAGVAAWIAIAPLPRYPVEQVSFTVDTSPERVARGRRTVEMLCAACHLDPATGALTGKRMPDLPPQFGESWSRNITRDPVEGIGKWTDAEIAYLVRTGVARDGRYIPPWMIKAPNMSDEDLKDLIAFLRSDDPLVRPHDTKDHDSTPSFLTKVLCRVAFKPLPWPESPVVAPDPSDEVAYGRYLVNGRWQCFSCHSADFATNDDLHPERSAGYLGGGNPMPDVTGATVLTANLTPDPETGIGGWSEDDFRRAVVHGIAPGNRPLRYPMVPYRLLDDGDVAAMFAYLRTVPALRNEVARPQAPAAAVADSASADRGRQVYYAYGCNGCHGDTGVGQWDLRKGPTDFPTDEELIGYIKHPEIAKPGVAMPTWDGVIQEDEYAPLVAYVRSLAAKSPPTAN